MSTSTTPSVSPDPANAAKRRSIEVREFAWLRPDLPLTPVFHYRTVYDDEIGTVQRDILSTETLLEQIIRTFGGEAELNGTLLHGYFDDPEPALECAQAIELHQTRPVTVHGNRIVIAI